MSSKKQTAKVKTTKKTIEKKTKKPVKKVVKKTVTKKPVEKTKTVTSTVRTKTTENRFGLMNIVAIVIVIAIIGFVAYLTSAKTTKPTQQIKAVSTINYDCNANQNALALLKENNKIETQDSSYGTFVDSINSQATTSDSFWIFYVNGEMATVGPDQYTCKDGDKVEWRFEKIL